MRRQGIGKCRDCGISPQLVNEEGKCAVCQDRAPQLSFVTKGKASHGNK